jgi:hypothetical protein
VRCRPTSRSAPRFWFSQLTLIQALTLWALPDSPRHPGAHANPAPTSARWQGNSPRKRVDHWLSIAGRDTERTHLTPALPEADGPGRLHPFVREAAALAVRALETGHPERYLWIDKTGAVNKVGSRPSDPTQPRIHNLWIPPSTGWTALDRRAPAAHRRRTAPAQPVRAGRARGPPALPRAREPERSTTVPHRRPEPDAA